MNHAVSTALVAGLLVFIAGTCAGFVVGVREGPSYYDALRVEQRLREVFCEQAVRNKILQSCEGMK